MKYNQEQLDILNYILIKNQKSSILKYYKLYIKDIGCNAKCPFCNDWLNKGDIKKIKIFLYKALKNIILDPIKYKHIQILGGEPILIFNDIIKIIKIGREYNITFDFPTNGSLLSIDKINLLISAGLDNFTFSLDFPNENHDNWRKLPGTYKKIINFTNYIQNKGLKVQWNTVIGNFNINEIKNFQDLYYTVKPNIHNFINIEQNGGTSKINFLNNMQISKVNSLLKKIEKNNTNIQIIKNGFYKISNSKTTNNKLCFIPIKTITYKIDERGFSLSPCYYDPNKTIKNISDFTKKAITSGCNKCNSSCKDSYNNYMLKLIKKYKLSNK